MMGTDSPARSVRSLVNGFISWVKSHSRRALISAVIGGVVAWFANIVLIVFKHDGWQKVPPGSPATGQGNLVSGGLFWGLASSLVFGVLARRRAVGKEQFWKDVRNLPDQIRALFRRDGKNASIHVLWGAGIAMLSTAAISPALGGILAVGLIATLPGVLGRLFSGLLYSVWGKVMQAVAPTTRHPPDPSATFAVTIAGAAASLAVAFFIPSRTAKLIAGGVLCALALALSLQRKQPVQAAAAFIGVVVAAILLADVLDPQHAYANDGGYTECGRSLVEWFRRCPGKVQVLINSAGGGLAGAGGAPIGEWLGGLNPKDFPSEPPNPFDPSIREQIEKWVNEGLIWDPNDLTWRPPRAGEVPPPSDFPEDAPFTKNISRDRVPPSCLALYDRYVKAQAKALQAQGEIDAARTRLQQVQDHLNRQLAKFTLKTGYDIGSLVGGGLDAVRGAGAGLGDAGRAAGWPEGSPPPGAIGQALAAARARLATLTAKAKSLADEVFDLSGKVSRVAQTARNLAEDATRLARALDEATGASEAAEKAAEKLRGWLSAARRAEPIIEERNRVVGELVEAEQKLKVHEQALREIQQLQMWAGQMKSAFDGESSRLFKIFQDDVARIDKEVAEILSRGAGGNPPLAESARFHQLLMEKGALPSKGAWEKFNAIGWEQYAANSDPAKFQDFVLRARGVSALDRPAAMDALMKRVVELRKVEADLEKRLADVRGSLPAGKTVAGLTDEVSQAEAAARRAKSNLDEAATASKGAKAQADDASKALTEAEGARNVKDGELKGVQGEIANLESEIKRLEMGGPDAGGGLTGTLRAIASSLGSKWVYLFGADQTPEQMAAILMKCRQDVVDAYNRVSELEKQHADALAELKEVDGPLDRCIEAGGVR